MSKTKDIRTISTMGKIHQTNGTRLEHGIPFDEETYTPVFRRVEHGEAALAYTQHMPGSKPRETDLTFKRVQMADVSQQNY